MGTRITNPIPHTRVAIRANGFTLLDVLVTMLIIAVLIGLLLPAISKVNEVARRVACQSNVRQLGIAMLTYADEHKEFLPHSVLIDPPSGIETAKRPSDMIYARLDSADNQEHWDGLGHLYKQDYLPAAPVFYCPSHSGGNRYEQVFGRWQQQLVSIPTNYHYRGEGPAGLVGINGQPIMTRQLFRIDPAQSSLIADGMRSLADVNHGVGANFFRADLSVHWFHDQARSLQSSIPVDADATTGGTAVVSMWNMFDQSANMSTTTQSNGRP